MHRDKCYWNLFVEYINSLQYGELFTHGHLFEVYWDKYQQKLTHTIDTYRRVLEVNSIVGKSDTPGIYIKLRDIPDGMSYNELRLRGYGRKEMYKSQHGGSLLHKTGHYVLIPEIKPNPLYKNETPTLLDLV